MADGSKGRKRYELKIAEELHRITGRIHQWFREIDRTDPDKAKRTYREKVWDKATGAVPRHVDKPVRIIRGVEMQNFGRRRTSPLDP